MKKKLPALAVLFVLGAFASVFFLVIMISAQVKITRDEQNTCPDGSTAAVASTNYTGDLGTIRAPWVGAATYTSKFGMRVNPGNLWKGQYRLHAGVDIAETPKPNLVVSATKGTYKRAYTAPEGANIVEIDVGGGTVLQYIHLASFAPGLKPGDPVWPGAPLGQEGSTGNSSGPHLHFQVMVNGKPTEPWAWLKEHGFKDAPAPSAEGTVLPVGPPAVTSKPANLNAATTGTASASPVADKSSPSSASSSSAPGTSGTVAQTTVTLPGTTGPGVEYTSNPPLPIPANMLSLYQAAGKRYGVPWPLLAGIGMAETGHGRIKAVSSAGAQGPMQFMPASFAAYGVDGNNDGKKVITDPPDSVFAAAHMLSATGATKGAAGIRSAIFSYNHSQEYVNSVVSYTKYYAGGKATISVSSTDTSAATACDVSTGGSAASAQTVGDIKTSGPYEAAAIAAAKSQIGVPYVWGGGDKNGPTSGGFDCSGFALYVVAQGTKKAGRELDLPHQSNEQYTVDSLGTVASYSGSGTPDYSKMRPGDVIVFNLVSGEDRHDWNHVGIYIGDGKMIHAPRTGKTVSAEPVPSAGKGAWVARRPKTTYTGS